MIKCCIHHLIRFAPGHPNSSRAIPHALYLSPQNPLYAQFDVLGDKLLNNPSHASHSRPQSHDYITSTLADLTTQHGQRDPERKKRDRF